MDEHSSSEVGLACDWLGTFVVTFVSALLWGKKDSSEKQCHSNRFSQPYEIAVQFAWYLSVVCVVIYIYYRISRAAKLQAARINTMNVAIDIRGANRSTEDPRASKTTSKATKYMVMVICTYIGTWTMYFVVGSVAVSKPILTTSIAWRVFLHVAFYLMLLNSCLNLFIYAAYLKDFSRAYKILLCRKTQNDVEPLDKCEIT